MSGPIISLDGLVRIVNGASRPYQGMSSQPDGHRSIRDTETPSLPKDDAYHVLQNSRRRAVLRYFFAEDRETFWLRDIAETIAAWEYDTTTERLGSTERQRVYIALYQSHLPKFDDLDIVEYDASAGRVILRPRAYALEPLVGDELDAPESLRVGKPKPATENSAGLLSQLLPR